LGVGTQSPTSRLSMSKKQNKQTGFVPNGNIKPFPRTQYSLRGWGGLNDKEREAAIMLQAFKMVGVLKADNSNDFHLLGESGSVLIADWTILAHGDEYNVILAKETRESVLGVFVQGLLKAAKEKARNATYPTDVDLNRMFELWFTRKLYPSAAQVRIAQPTA
jgi:hypothetical protein